MKNLKKGVLTASAVIAFVFSMSAQKNYFKDAEKAYDTDRKSIRLNSSHT